MGVKHWVASAFQKIGKEIRALVIKQEPIKLAYPAEWFDWMRENTRQNATIGAQRTRAGKLDYRKVKSQKRNMGHWGRFK